MSADDDQVMKTLEKAAIETGRAVYYAHLHYALGVSLYDKFCDGLFQKEALMTVPK